MESTSRMCLLLAILVHGLVSPLHGWIFQINNERDRRVNQVCYDGLGCFSDAPPFDNAGGDLPASPEEIGLKFYLYTENEAFPGTYITTRMFPGLGVPSAFRNDTPIVLVIHGYRENILKPHLKQLFGQLVNLGGLNVIVLDWEDGALALYDKSVANTRVVGALTAVFLRALFSETGQSAADVHLIGYSLGAHIAGYVGRGIPGLARITALDPAGPLFQDSNPVVRLNPSDALFVDAIHTNGAPLIRLGFGMKAPLGHVDFYPNGGDRQPGCGNTWQRLVSLLTGEHSDIACSHRRSVELFTESINSQCSFLSQPCRYRDIRDDYCLPCQQGSSCVVMGYHINQTVRGTFYTETNPQTPYCIG